MTCVFNQEYSLLILISGILQANFARAVASLSQAQAKKVARFLPNPERNWGPKLRAGRQITSKHVSLLGPKALNAISNHGDGEGSNNENGDVSNHENGDGSNHENGNGSNHEDVEEPAAKRKKTEESDS